MLYLRYHFWEVIDTNHNSLLWNATYTRPPRLRYIFQVVQTQTTTAYCGMLPTLDHHV